MYLHTQYQMVLAYGYHLVDNSWVNALIAKNLPGNFKIICYVGFGSKGNLDIHIYLFLKKKSFQELKLLLNSQACLLRTIDFTVI